MLKEQSIDSWSAKEQLSLAHAVLSSGDQNWVAVSRSIKQLSTEGPRPADWFSTKNCALQYAHLLEGVAPAKRKRERSSLSSASSFDVNETPAETLAKNLSKKRIEELNKLVQEEKEAYNNLLQEINNLESGNLDDKLDSLWEQMVQEEKDDLEEQRKYDEWAKKREENTAIPIPPQKQEKEPTTPHKVTPDSQSQSSKDAESNATLPNIPNNSLTTTTEENSTPVTIKMDPMDTDPPTYQASTVEVKPSVKDYTEETVVIKQEKEDEPLGDILESKAVESLTQEDKTADGINSSQETENVNKNTPLETKDEDDLKLNEEVLRIGEVQRKYGRARREAKEEEEEEDMECIEGEEEEGFAGFGPPNIGDVIKTEVIVDEKKAVDDDVYNIDNDDTIGLRATKKFKTTEQSQLARANTFDSEDSNDSKVAPPSGGKDAAEGDRSERRGKRKTEEKNDFDDCDSVESFATNKSSACESDSCLSRGTKRKLTLPTAESPHNFSDVTPESPASSIHCGDDPEFEKAFKAWRKSVMILYNEIAAHKFANVFLKPISEERVPGYHAIVKRPMDLQTIKRNIESGHIRTTEEFQRDIMLMCTNAVIFNTKGQIHDMAYGLMNDAIAKMNEFQSASNVITPESLHKSLRRETRESIAKRGEEPSVTRRRKK